MFPHVYDQQGHNLKISVLKNSVIVRSRDYLELLGHQVVAQPNPTRPFQFHALLPEFFDEIVF